MAFPTVWLAMAMQAAQAVPDAGDFDLRESSRRRGGVVTSRCRDGGDAGDIVVCGGRDDRHRLPLPRAPMADTGGNGGTPLAAITPTGRCGIFVGERRCDKREAAAYGYGNGRDPISVVMRLADRLAEPD